jgi:hypothetical protein
MIQQEQQDPDHAHNNQLQALQDIILGLRDDMQDLRRQSKKLTLPTNTRELLVFTRDLLHGITISRSLDDVVDAELLFSQACANYAGFHNLESALSSDLDAEQLKLASIVGLKNAKQNKHYDTPYNASSKSTGTCTRCGRSGHTKKE